MSAVTSINMLNEILVFDLSLAIWSMRTNQLHGNSYGHPTSWKQPQPSWRQRLSGARRVGPRNATSFVMEVARSSHRSRTQRVDVQWAMGPDPCALRILDRRVDLSDVPR